MKPRPRLPRSLRLAVIAGQFRQQRVDMISLARAESPANTHREAMRRYYVADARAINWVMITQLRAARRAYASEL